MANGKPSGRATCLAQRRHPRRRYAFVSDDRGAVHALDRSNGAGVEAGQLANRQLSVRSPRRPSRSGDLSYVTSSLAIRAPSSRAWPRAAADRHAPVALPSGLLVQTQKAGCCGSRSEAVIALVGRPNVGKSTLFTG